MTDKTPAARIPLTVLGTGAMGTALVRAWLAAGHPVTVWNRTTARTGALAAEGAAVAASAAEAVAASRLVIVCLLDDASVGAALDGAGLTGRDLVNLTTGTPAEGRARAGWARERGARFLDGGIMAVPPMIGSPESGGYVFYSGSAELFEEHRDTLAVPAGTRYVGQDAGYAALHDVALLSAMSGMFAGIMHAFALIGPEDIAPRDFAPLLVSWLGAMTGSARPAADRIESGDYAKDVVSNLAMQVAGNATLLRTAAEQGVSPELLTPYTALLERWLAEGHGTEDTTGAVELLNLRRTAASTRSDHVMDKTC
ncbi:NAD(P)-binding domain-containing protein [Streptomyces violaceoruber]|uniref:NAD(P)-binding domain-containing protein n=3 Tax=Streptomyces TaxID=1883 RepID=A0ACD4WSZ1_STRVN|nr:MULTISPECIES: NAD(P)-binding domain-containing protein [Streptomyces]WOZ00675.1 NAD(P)-binding domain-containing protein [Streptomyces violaceoruber]MCW8118901.1 NAD(P)-binding domain-containing protein [Streptomyces anthocyanicus]MCZ4636216.1 NAD(P)-binding domain-containing protein [Streptomyces rubrogriseus]MDX2924097.1 NAD(P)-binding domain-containing protein [Streptomyces sp. NRRL_B-16638]MDX3317194.1 NAD(P)-binding domain-containing protein [Streptomyces sp. ME03-5684b]